jgi:L-ascorbate metabolism protein UlaG (beta-lactamase superfamily)
MPADKVEKAARLDLKQLRGVKEWESDIFRGMRLTAVPARHSGGELGLVIEADRTIYFAGDTSLDPEVFAAISQRWNLDAVLLPIGDLRSMGIPYGHINPRKAPKALKLLGEPHIVVPTHYSGFRLRPLMSFWGTPRKLAQRIRQADLGTVVGTSRPLEQVVI